MTSLSSYPHSRKIPTLVTAVSVSCGLQPPARSAPRLVDVRLFRFFLTQRTQLVANASDAILNESEHDSLSCCVSPIHRPNHLVDSPCTRHASAWMRSFGFSRTNSSHRKRRRLLYRWHVTAKNFEDLCWIHYGRLGINYSHCSSLFRRTPRR